MTTQRPTLWAALVSLALGASLLHYRIHPPNDLTYLWPTLFSLLDLVLVSALFRFRSTALLGLLLNSFLAFLGIKSSHQPDNWGSWRITRFRPPWRAR